MIEQKVALKLEEALAENEQRKAVDDENRLFLAIYERQAQAQERIADAMERIAKAVGNPETNDSILEILNSSSRQLPF